MADAVDNSRSITAASQTGKAAEGDQRVSASVSDLVDALGFGMYQVQVFILSAGFIVAEGSELQMASGLTNAISLEFGITSHVGRSLLMTCTFCGFAVGTIVSGPIGDLLGRRAPMAIGYVGVLCTAFVTYFAWSTLCIYILRFVLGFFGGIGIPVALITISEVSPMKLRGVSTAALGVAYCLGDIWAALGLWFVMPDLQTGPWRRLLAWAAVPATSLLIFGLWSPAAKYDTPYWLATQHRDDDVASVLRLIAQLNGKPCPQVFPKSNPARSVATGHVEFWKAMPLMLEWPTSLYSVLLCLLFFGKDFGYYGMGVFWPLAWAEVTGVGSLWPAQELFLTAIFGIPGIAVAMYMMYMVERRLAIAIGGLVCSGAALLITRLDYGDERGLIGVLMFKLFFPTWQMVTMLLPSEIFPTIIRSWAYGLVAVFGRFATILAPTVVEGSHAGFLGLCASLGLMSAMCAMLLPETKDRPLKEISGLADGPMYGAADNSKGATKV